LAFAVACRCGITLVDWVGTRGVMPLLGVLARRSRGNGSPSPSPSPARSSGACPQRQRRGTSQPSGRGGVRVRVVPRRVVGPLLGAAGGALPCRGGGSGGASRGGVGDRGPGPASGVFQREYSHLLQLFNLFYDELIVVLINEQLLVDTLCMGRRHKKG
jgi:hypothetical protein